LCLATSTLKPDPNPTHPGTHTPTHPPTHPPTHTHTHTHPQLLWGSVDHYIECLWREPTYPGAMNNLGNALKEMDLFIPALRAWQTALRLQVRV